MTIGVRERGAIAGVIVGVLLTFAIAAEAYHQPSSQTKGKYPNISYIWLDEVTIGTVWQASDRCENAEITMHATFADQLKGASEGNSAQYRGKWPRGIDLLFYDPGTGAVTTNTCTTSALSEVDDSTDWFFDYVSDTSQLGTNAWTDTGHPYDPQIGLYTGESHSDLAPTSWCNIWLEPNIVNDPGVDDGKCGYVAPTTIHIWKERFQGYAYDYRVRFLLHEVAHGLGFRDYCGHSHTGTPPGSVSRNGGSCSLTVTGYYPMDRLLIGDYIHEDSPYTEN